VVKEKILYRGNQNRKQDLVKINGEINKQLPEYSGYFTDRKH
jgi:hypothetical protein